MKWIAAAVLASLLLAGLPAGAQAPAGCVMPDVHGFSLQAARQALRNAGCPIGLATYRKDKARFGFVIRQYPTARTPIAAAPAVALVVSGGPRFDQPRFRTGNFDGNYRGQLTGTVTVTAPNVAGVTMPLNAQLNFRVKDGRLIGAGPGGVILDASGRSLIVFTIPVPGGNLVLTQILQFTYLPTTDAASFRGSLSGTYSDPVTGAQITITGRLRGNR